MVSWVVTIFDHIKDNYLLHAEWEFLKFKNFHLGRPQNPSRRFPANGKSTETFRFTPTLDIFFTFFK